MRMRSQVGVRMNCTSARGGKVYCALSGPTDWIVDTALYKNIPKGGVTRYDSVAATRRC